MAAAWVERPSVPFLWGYCSFLFGIRGLQNDEMRGANLRVGLIGSVFEDLPEQECDHGEGDEGAADGSEDHAEEGSLSGSPRFLGVVEGEVFGGENADGGAGEEADGAAYDDAEERSRECAEDAPAGAAELFSADGAGDCVENEGEDGEEGEDDEEGPGDGRGLGEAEPVQEGCDDDERCTREKGDGEKRAGDSGDDECPEKGPERVFEPRVHLPNKRFQKEGLSDGFSGGGCGVGSGSAFSSVVGLAGSAFASSARPSRAGMAAGERRDLSSNHFFRTAPTRGAAWVPPCTELSWGSPSNATAKAMLGPSAGANPPNQPTVLSTPFANHCAVPVFPATVTPGTDARDPVPLRLETTEIMASRRTSRVVGGSSIWWVIRGGKEWITSPVMSWIWEMSRDA